MRLFLGARSLAPDTYSVSLEKDQYSAFSEPGVTVFADSTQTVSVNLIPKLKTILTERSKVTSNLVKSGTTADVYSVNASTQDKISALGGGGSLAATPATIRVTIRVSTCGWSRHVRESRERVLRRI